MKKRILIQTLKWFLPLLFITFINGEIFFTHSHSINDSFVVHSHPFSKSENTTHSHTTNELIAIEFHTHGHSTTAIIPHIEINSPFQYLDHHVYSYDDKIDFAQNTNTFFLRAPPFIYMHSLNSQSRA